MRRFPFVLVLAVLAGRDPEAEDMHPAFEVRDGACWFTVPRV